MRDKFLQEQIKEDDGWVSMDTMLNFKRLSSLSNEKDVITAALKKSESGLMEVRFYSGHYLCTHQTDCSDRQFLMLTWHMQGS